MPNTPDDRSDRLRLFIAIQLPSPIKAQLETLQNQLSILESRSSQSSAASYRRIIRWTATQNLHLTLKFLGETSQSNVEKIQGELTHAAKGQHPFKLYGQGIGAFPTVRRPSIMWVGLDGQLDALLTLQKAVETFIAPLGFPTEDRGFTAHLTLGRVDARLPAAILTTFGNQLQEFQTDQSTKPITERWSVDAVVLMQSSLHQGGSVYTELATFSLAE